MYVDMRMQTWPRSPGVNVATHKSQSCCLSWCLVAALQSAGICQLWCLGVPGGAPRVLYTAAGCTHVFALLVTVKVQPRMLAAEQHGNPCTFWNVPLACAATRAHFWGFGPACFLPSFTAYPACETSILAPSPRNMNERCNLSQLNALFTEGKTHITWAQNLGHEFGSWATNFNIVAPFWGPESGPCFGATKRKRELFNTGSKCATAAAGWQQHISVILQGYMPEKLSLPLLWGSGFKALGPPRLWEKAPPMPMPW